MDIATALQSFMMLGTLTLGITQVYKEVISDKNTQKASVIIAMILSLVTGTSILQPLGFVPAHNFVDLISQFKIGYDVLYWMADIAVTGFLASKGSSFTVDLFNKKNIVETTSTILEKSQNTSLLSDSKNESGTIGQTDNSDSK